jgi:hypothetical protein
MRALRASYCLARTPGLVATALVGMAMCGCSSTKSKPIPVAGKILFEGEPLAQAQVVLVPVDAADKADAPRPAGVTDAQGRFELTTYKQKDGAPEGEYLVLVQYHPIVQRPGQDAEVGPNALPARYADPRQSPLRVTVSKGASELKPLEISRN